MGNQISCASSLSIAIAPNTIRCIPSRPLVITVVNLANGRACQVEQAMKVGELMLEIPGHFVAQFDEHMIMPGSMPEVKSKRISALPADRDLCAHHLYFLLPMHRIHTRLSAQELRNIVAVTRLPRCSNPAPAFTSTSKITPLSSLQYEEAESCITIEHTLQGLIDTGVLLGAGALEGKLLEDEEEMKGDGTHDKPGLPLHRLRRSRSRSWIPKLDTILESSPLTIS
eukprot:c18432_g1_i3 orf=212-892(-)